VWRTFPGNAVLTYLKKMTTFFLENRRASLGITFMHNNIYITYVVICITNRQIRPKERVAKKTTRKKSMFLDVPEVDKYEM
jgi:hypothetical protein